MEQKKRIMNTPALKRTAAILLGSFLYALGINMFVVPAGIYTGGVMGICQIIRTVLVDILCLIPADFDIAGILYYIINVPLFVLAWKRLERGFVLRTLLSVTAMTVLLSVLPVRNLLGGDTITGCIVGGVIAGGGSGLFLWGSACGGGVDTAAMMLLQKGSHIKIGRLSLVINIFICTVCLVLFDVNTAVYSVIYFVIYAFALDKLHFQNILEEFTIITKEEEGPLEDDIFKNIRRGVTKIEARGGYTNDRVTMLYVVVTKDEGPALRSIIEKHDKNAFVIIREQADVYGNFKKHI